MSTRDAIIKAATRLFAEKGYEGMTLQAIADQVGIKPPSVYAFFKNKADVLHAIYKELVQGHLQLTIGVLAAGEHASLEAQLKNLVDAIIDFQYRNDTQAKIYIRFLLFPPKALREDIREPINTLYDQERDLFVQLFEAGIAKGEIRQADPLGLATLFLCLLDGLFWQMQRMEEAEFRRQLAVTWNQFWSAIKA